MSNPAAIKGTFSDFRLIKSRSIAQVILEIPIEEGDRALEALGGLPRPDREAWVAIARLNVTSIKPQAEKRKFESLKEAMQAGIRCNEPAFWRFLEEEIKECSWHVDDEEKAAEAVRRFCRVGSRSALNLDPKAAAKWQELDARYLVWLREPQHA